MKKIILFELNEVPFFILDQYADSHPRGFIAKLLKNSAQYETINEDTGELSPWITWPTLHRGVTKTDHTITDFSQDLTEINKAYPPIWSILTDNSIKTGVFGSLHTEEVTAIEDYSFYVPDVFASTSKTFPTYVQAFQDYNLKMSRQSARNVSSNNNYKLAAGFIKNLNKLGIGLKSAGDITKQLIHEQINSSRRNRRRTYQSVLSFDVFYKLLASKKPEFCTYFTNNVASSMHRFWAAAFPNHYKENDYAREWITCFKDEINFSLSKVENMLLRLDVFIKKNPDYSLWITSSMGQEATVAKPVKTQLYLTEGEKLMAYSGLQSSDYKFMPAMLPQVNIRFHDEIISDKFKRFLQKISIQDNKLSFRKMDKYNISIDFGQENLSQSDFLRVDGELLTPNQLGLCNVEIDDGISCNAYHIHSGSLLVYPSKPCVRTQISSASIASSILTNYSITKPDYLNSENFLR